MIQAASHPRDVVSPVRELILAMGKDLDWSRGVFLKPNVVYPVPGGSGEVTRPQVVRAVIQVLREIQPGVEIIVGEGPAAGTDPEDNFRVSGHRAVAEECGVPLLDLHTVQRVKVPWAFGELPLPLVLTGRIHISLPILKPSPAALLSGAVKNQKGLLEPSIKKAFHRWGLHRPLMELGRTVKPDLILMDGRNFFRGETFLGGTDACELDLWAVSMLRCPEPEYLRLMREAGLGAPPGTVPGENEIRLQRRFVPEGPRKEFLRLRLWSNPRACSMCRLPLHELRRIRSREGRRSYARVIRLLWASFKGADLVFGGNPVFTGDGRKVICIGDCTRELAKNQGYHHVPGCPPSAEDILKTF